MNFFQEKIFWKEEVCKNAEGQRWKKKKVELKKKAADKEKYFYYNTDGHWKWNCPTYLATLKNKKEIGPSGGMLIIESNLMIFFYIQLDTWLWL